MHFYNFKFFCFLDKFDFSLINSLPKNTTIIYRNYSITNNINEIIKIKKHCHKKKIKIFLSNNFNYYYSPVECKYFKSPCTNYLIKNVKHKEVLGYNIIFKE